MTRTNTATSRLADTFVKIRRDGDFEVIWAIRQLLRGIDLPASFDVGVPHDAIAAARRCKWRTAATAPCSSGLGLAQRGIGHKNVEALAATRGGPQRPHSLHGPPAANSGRRHRRRCGPLLADRLPVCRESWPAAIRATIRASTPRTICWSAAKSMRVSSSAAKPSSICRRGLGEPSNSCRRLLSIIRNPDAVRGDGPNHDGHLRHSRSRNRLSHG